MTASGRPADLDAVVRELAAGFARAGWPLDARVRATYRPGLRANATTLREGDGYLVLVRDRAPHDGGLALLLAHELGHVQRMASGHASHDDDAITAAYEAVEAQAPRAFQQAILHHVINHTQDLYADPLSFRVARELRLVEPAWIDALLAGFTNDTPYEVADPLERRWDRAEDVVGNARAIALARLAGTPASLDAAQRAQARYLLRIEPDIAREAPWFQRRLDELPEDPTRDEFRALLVEYVRRFVATANGA
jgi:hypothetical protein